MTTKCWFSKYSFVGLTLVLLVSIVVPAACAKPARTPTPTASPTPAPSPAPVQNPAGTSGLATIVKVASEGVNLAAFDDSIMSKLQISQLPNPPFTVYSIHLSKLFDLDSKTPVIITIDSDAVVNFYAPSPPSDPKTIPQGVYAYVSWRTQDNPLTGNFQYLGASAIRSTIGNGTNNVKVVIQEGGKPGYMCILNIANNDTKKSHYVHYDIDKQP